TPLSFHLFFLRLPRPPTSTLFPYTTLFRSHASLRGGCLGSAAGGRAHAQCYADGARGILDCRPAGAVCFAVAGRAHRANAARPADRKSTRLNSSHVSISYAVFCLKKKKKNS